MKQMKVSQHVTFLNAKLLITLEMTQLLKKIFLENEEKKKMEKKITTEVKKKQKRRPEK